MGYEDIKKAQELNTHLAMQQYAEADKSDPFTMARCLSHHQNGIDSPRTDNGEQAIYFAEKQNQSETLPHHLDIAPTFQDGSKTFKKTGYVRMQRP